MKRQYKVYQVWIGDFRFFITENIRGIRFILVGGIIVFSLFYASFENISTLFQDYNCETECTTVNGIAKEYIFHGLDGSHAGVFAYDVEYGYEVEGYNYTSKKVIDNNIANSKIITLIIEGKTKSMIIKYDCEKPYKSTIAIR